MAIIRFSYLKLQRKNQSTFTPGSAVTTYVVSQNAEVAPLGGGSTAAPSTVIFERSSGNTYFLNKPFSASHAAMVAATSDAAPISLI